MSTLFYIDNKKIEVSFKKTNSVGNEFSNGDVIYTYRKKYNNEDVSEFLPSGKWKGFTHIRKLKEKL